MQLRQVLCEFLSFVGGSDFGRHDAQQVDVLLVRSAAADLALRVAFHARGGVAHGTQAIAAARDLNVGGPLVQE